MPHCHHVRMHRTCTKIHQQPGPKQPCVPNSPTYTPKHSPTKQSVTTHVASWMCVNPITPITTVSVDDRKIWGPHLIVFIALFPRPSISHTFLGQLVYDDDLCSQPVQALLLHFVLMHNTSYYTGGYAHRRLSYVDNMLKALCVCVVKSRLCVLVCAVCVLLYTCVCEVRSGSLVETSCVIIVG